MKKRKPFQRKELKSDKYDKEEIFKPGIVHLQPKRADALTATDAFQQQIEILRAEWAIKYADRKVMHYLVQIKGYTNPQAIKIIQQLPAKEWKAYRKEMESAVIEGTVKRHTEMIAEAQENHVRASNLGMAKAIELLSKMTMDPLIDDEGKPVIDKKTGKPIYKGYRSIDVLNCINAIKSAQDVYRRAMGLPNDGEGMIQILEKLQGTQIQNNTQINIGGVNSPPEGSLAQLDYDEVMTLIEHKREKMQKEQQQEKTISGESADIDDDDEDLSQDDT